MVPIIMKNINSLNPENYQIYASVKAVLSNPRIYLIRQNIDTEYFNFDAFICEDYTIFAFPKFDTASTEYVYKIVDGDNVYRIQYDSYERCRKVIEGEYQIDTNSFTILDSAPIQEVIASGKQLIISEENRCDAERYGPTRFPFIENGLDEPAFDFDYHKPENMKAITFILNSVKDCHITNIEWKEYPDSAFRNNSSVTRVARTLTGAIKMLLEWAEVADEPWNSTERLAEACKGFVESLNIPQNVIDEVKSTQEDMAVAKFLSSDPACRQPLTESVNIPPLTKAWILSQLRYESLNSLCLRNPEIAIPDEILQQEKIKIYTLIYQFFLLQGVDAESYTLTELQQMIDSGKFKSDLDGARQIRDELKKAIDF
jgi:hypothetical protein